MSLLLELGTFGDIVELSRKQLLEGYVREQTPEYVRESRIISMPIFEQLGQAPETEKVPRKQVEGTPVSDTNIY